MPGLPVAPERGTRRVWWIVAGVLLLLVVLRFAPRVENPFRPKPRAAHVAIRLDDEEFAADGMREIAAGRSFRLYAVLEAESPGGGTIYYTEAPVLRLGGRQVPAEEVRTWPESRPVRVRWQTIEGFSPYLAVASAADLDRFHLVENLHSEWGTGWSAEGAVDPRLAQLEPGSTLRPLAFGTQRYAVRIELWEDDKALTPSARWSSPGAEQVLAEPESATGVVAALPPPLDVVSAAFGRTRLDPAAELDAETTARIASLVKSREAFLEPALLAQHLRSAGLDPTRLRFETVELGADGPRWGIDVLAGDLLGAGGRQLVLWRDEGVTGRLDPADLGFDFHRGLRIQPFGQVFEGDDELRLDLAPIVPREE